MSISPYPSAAPPIALTIAGFDPSSGAGATADLLTFAAHGVFGVAGLSALTVQSTLGVRRVQPLQGALLSETLRCLEDDLSPAGIKIGMLGCAEIVDVVVLFLQLVRSRRPVYVVLDPVLRSSSGAMLLEEKALRVVSEQLLPLCDCVTPNHSELASLLGAGSLQNDELPDAARKLQQGIGGSEVVITGGDAATPNDLVLSSDGDLVWLEGTRIDTTSTHGTGCAFSSALLSRHLLGDELVGAARAAKAYVEGALRSAPRLGAGRGPMNLLWTRPLP